MPTRMTHPQHGAMYVYGQGEVDRHINLGWSLDAPTFDVAGDGHMAAIAAPITETFPVLKRKPGRPPKAK